MYAELLETHSKIGRIVFDHYRDSWSQDREGIDDRDALVGLITNLLLGYSHDELKAEDIVRRAMEHYRGDIDDAEEEANASA